MTWAEFYMVCFVVGFVLSTLIFIMGGGRLHLPHIHLPGLHAHGTAFHAPASRAAAFSPFNLITLTAFLTWFGGTGYLLARHSTLWFFTALAVSMLSGVGGAAIIYLFLARVLSSPAETLNSADFEMVGVLGKLSVRVREGGTGELIYSQAGTRRVCGARSEDGSAIPKSTEVVVTRYDRGIAYVRPWSEMAGDEVGVAEPHNAGNANQGRPQ